MCVQSIAPITLGKPALAANCALMLACSTALYGNLIYLADMRIIPSHTAGMVRLRVDWHSPDRSASSLWNAPVARNPSVVSTCMGTGSAWLLAVSRSKAGRSSAHSSRRIALGNLKRLMSQLSSCASKSSLSLNTRSLRIAPFTMSSNTAKAAIVVNGSLFSAPLCACFYIFFIIFTSVNCSCVSDVHITLRSNCFHMINSFPASPLSVANGPKAVETCVRQP